MTFATNLGLSLLMLAVGCQAGEIDDTDTDKADDLVGRTVIVHARSPAVFPEVPSARTAKPEVKETGDTVEIWTDDIRLVDPEYVFVDVAIFAQKNSRHLLRLDYRPEGSTGEDSWQTLKPVENV